MDARWFNGPDEREYGIDPDDERCPDCGAEPNDPCELGCQCQSCRLRRLDVIPEDAA